MFVDITGIDGSGKSTVCRQLHKMLTKDKIKCKVFHGYVPRSTMFLLRDIYLKTGMEYKDATGIETLGMLAALNDIYCNVKAIFNDSETQVYIAEKYIKDSVVYMPLLGGNKELALMFEKNLPVPDLRVILDVDPKIAYRRVIERFQSTGKEIQEKEKYEIMCSARKVFLGFARESNTIILDATQPPEAIAYVIFKRIKENIK